MKTWHKLLTISAVFLGAYLTPFNNPNVQKAIMSAFFMMQDYAQKHVLLCLIPAFFIAGAVSVFLSKNTVIKYLGAEAKKITAYFVASVSGTILAVCSCTVLPLFSSIYRMGAGIGPACAFLYSGPAINVLAIVLTAKILGWQIGLARAIGAISFAFIIGLLMAITFPKKSIHAENADISLSEAKKDHKLKDQIFIFFSMIAVLVFVNWAKPDAQTGVWHTIYTLKWYITSAFGLLFASVLIKYFNFKKTYVGITALLVLLTAFIIPNHPQATFSLAVIGLIISAKFSGEEPAKWIDFSRNFAFTILPLLFGGVLVAGFLLGMPGEDTGIIPAQFITTYVGGNTWASNLFASVIGAFMYFATLTEVPILQGLINSGMGKGPALALLLSGPALSLPNMLVIKSVLGTKKTVVFIFYVVILSTIVGKLFGMIGA